MTVYVLLGLIDYEGATSYGVYSTRALAEDAAKRCISTSIEYVQIVEYEVDAAARSNWDLLEAPPTSERRPYVPR